MSQPEYGESLTKVEPYGVDHIPDNERHGKPVSQLFIWFAANLNFPITILGFSAVYLGLSFSAAVTAVFAGALGGSLLMAVMSRMGARLGVPQQIQARGPLGFFGNFLPVLYINVFAGIGWGALTVILAAKALNELVGLPFWLGALLLVAAQLVVCLFGYNMIHYVQRILAFVLCALFVLITVVALVRGSGTFAANPAAKGYVGATGGWVTFAGWFLSFLVAWSPFASDYSRYLPDTPQVANRNAVFTGLGNFITVFWLGVLGALVANSTTSSDSITALHQLTGPFAVPALLAVVLSAMSQNFLNIYGGAISVQTLRIPVKRSTAVIIICALAYVISLWGEAGVESRFAVFLNLTAYFIAPFATVLLLDYHLGGRHDRARIGELYDPSRVVDWGFVAWAFGVLASVPFWSSTAYTGFLAKAHPGWGDLSMFVGAAATVLAYLLTYRLVALWPKTPAGAPVTAAPPANAEVSRHQP
jgi:NCS1 nucleoside transporter family